MILFFHFLCLLVRYIFLNISQSLGKGKVFKDKNEDDFIKAPQSPYPTRQTRSLKPPAFVDNTLKFFPPVYVQRYETVAIVLSDLASKGKIKKVVDFGCAELGFFMYLKSIEELSDILEVDIDSEILKSNLYKAAPLTTDYLMSKRKKPLNVYILAGSIADFDDFLIGCDAVIGIELIEHLDEEAFAKMPYNIFHKVKPKLAIFTTPNAEFNSLFPNFKNVRHHDHKFEWTRKEFFNWTQEILKAYPEYSVRFYGIGSGPEGTENLGCCSQMAVFQRSDDAENAEDLYSTPREDSVNIQNYTLIRHYEYPFYTDNRSIEEKIIHEIQYQAAHLNTLDSYYNYECCESEIPISLLKEYVSDLCSTDEELVNILENNKMTIKERNNALYLVYTESASNSSDGSFVNDDYFIENFNDQNDVPNEDIWWDKEEVCIENTTTATNFSRSAEKYKPNVL